MIPGGKVGLGTRAWALLIDLLILNIIQGVLVTVLQGARGIIGFNILLWLAYSVYFDGVRGATPGKIFLGIRILRLDGSPADYQQVTVRCVAKLVPLMGMLAGVLAATVAWPTGLRTAILAAGLLPAVVWAACLHRHPRNQAPHDRLAGTWVIRVF